METPQRTWYPRQPKQSNYPSSEERGKTQKSISRQSARRDAIDFLVATSRGVVPFTVEEVFEVAERFYQWANK